MDSASTAVSGRMGTTASGLRTWQNMEAPDTRTLGELVLDEEFSLLAGVDRALPPASLSGGAAARLGLGHVSSLLFSRLLPPAECTAGFLTAAVTREQGTSGPFSQCLEDWAIW